MASSLTTSNNRMYTLEQKVEFLNKLDSRGSKSFKTMSQELGVSITLLKQILRERDLILSNFEFSRGPSKPFVVDLELFLRQWYLSKVLLGVPMTDLLIKKRALKLAERFNMTNFVASDEWLANFKTTHCDLNHPDDTGRELSRGHDVVCELEDFDSSGDSAFTPSDWVTLEQFTPVTPTVEPHFASDPEPCKQFEDLSSYDPTDLCHQIFDISPSYEDETVSDGACGQAETEDGPRLVPVADACVAIDLLLKFVLENFPTDVPLLCEFILYLNQVKARWLEL
ncbi:uncharacterized protein [Procambarus clarkii]|uniref:uncharacterized protein n=1 Tax=Procambarus clarkii TaxID=6728 RepID=UPI0037433EDB